MQYNTGMASIMWCGYVEKRVATVNGVCNGDILRIIKGEYQADRRCPAFKKCNGDPLLAIGEIKEVTPEVSTDLSGKDLGLR